MDLGLAGKTAIVTGGGSNIGRAIAITLAQEGARVVIAEIDEAQGQKVAQEIKGCGGTAVVIHTDVTDFESVQAMVRRVLEQFGQVDILVNNVGWTIDRLFVEKPREEWEKEIALNLWSCINCIRAVVDHMIERKYGKIISLGSDAGKMGEYREAVYAACKGGVMSLSKALARELGRYNINVNVVCPGVTVPQSTEEAGEKSMWTQWGFKTFTPEIQEKAARAYPLRRLGKPQDVANLVAFLASDRASFITGQSISVSGGYTMM